MTRTLTIIFLFFYVGVIIYLLLFFLVPDFQAVVIENRQRIANLTEGQNYFWALLISFLVCFIGSASIGFPVPFPFVLFSLSNSVYLKYRNYGQNLSEILVTLPFWFEILGIAVAGGLGCALGELTSFFLGKGAKKMTKGKELQAIKNVKGFGKLILERPKRTYIYIFIAAATPIPEDILWLSLGLLDKKYYSFYKCFLASWLGKNITTIFYCILPILFLLGFSALDIETNDALSVINEAIMLLVTLTLMLIIFAFDWNKLLENRVKRKQELKKNK